VVLPVGPAFGNLRKYDFFEAARHEGTLGIKEVKGQVLATQEEAVAVSGTDADKCHLFMHPRMFGSNTDVNGKSRQFGLLVREVFRKKKLTDH